jgi:hypothetical protein
MHKYKAVRRKYSDAAKAEALALLQAEGYPERRGSLVKVSRAIDVPVMTLADWYTAEHSIVSTDVRVVQTFNLASVIDAEIESIFAALPGKRDNASYRDLGIVLGILVDKKQLLMGMPTSITEHTHVFSEADREQAIKGYLDIAAQRKQGGMPPSDPLIADVAHRGMVDGVSTPPTPTLPPPQHGTSVSTVSDVPTNLDDTTG